MSQTPVITTKVEAMQDPLSRKSSESSSSSSDYVVVGENNKSLTSPVLEYVVSENELQDAIAANSVNMINSPSTPNVVGKSIFYDCLNDSSPLNDTDDGKVTKPLNAIFLITQFHLQMLQLTILIKIIRMMEISRFFPTSYTWERQTSVFQRMSLKFYDKSTNSMPVLEALE